MAAKCGLAQRLCRLRTGCIASGAKVLPLLLMLVLAILWLLAGGGLRKQPEGQSLVEELASARHTAARRKTDAERPVGCWRLGGGAGTAEDEGEIEVQCSPVAADGTLVAPAAVLAAAAGAALRDGDASITSSSSATRPPQAHYAYVACFSGRKAADGTVLVHFQKDQVTVASCVRACDKTGHAYAYLVGSRRCRCANQPLTARMLPDRRCQLACAGDRSTLCGGRRAATAVYHLRSADGSLEWTAWMTPWGDGGSSSGSATVRIRRCLALHSSDSNDSGRQEGRCSAELERRPGAGSLPQPLLLRHFVGCYAVASDPPSAVAALPNATSITEGCLSACEERGFAYAFVRLTDGCSCSRTLGVSRPVTFCDGVYGLPFYVVRAPPEDEEEDADHYINSDGIDFGDDEDVGNEDEYSDEDGNVGNDSEGDTDNEDNSADEEDVRSYSHREGQVDSADGFEDFYGEDDEDEEDLEEEEGENGSMNEKAQGGSAVARRATVELLFDRPPHDKRRVLLLAYHRSGSTFASELVSKHFGALYTFEPDVIYSHLRFALGEYVDIEQMHREFYRAFDRFLRCDVHRLPLIWMTLGSFFPRTFEHSPRMAAYIGCLRAHGSVACAPYFQAQCEAASIVSAKTIRLTATPQTTAFVRAHPELVVIHLMRDPRAVVSSRKSFTDFEDTDARNLCDNMQRTMLFIKDSHPADKEAEGAVAGSAVGSRSHLFNVYYEDLVLKPLQSARDIYTNMFRLNISDATVQRLRVITGEVRDDKPNFKLNPAFTTRKKNPELSLRKWLDQLTPSEVDIVEQLCASVLDWYPQAQQLSRSVDDDDGENSATGDRNSDAAEATEKVRRGRRRA